MERYLTGRLGRHGMEKAAAAGVAFAALSARRESRLELHAAGVVCANAAAVTALNSAAATMVMGVHERGLCL